MNLFSDSVANKVASQLLEAMHQYMNAAVRPRQIQGGLTDTPMITQEVASHSQLTPTKTLKPVVGVSAQVPGNGTLQMLQALEDITHPDTNLTFPRSNHDASNERIQTDTEYWIWFSHRYLHKNKRSEIQSSRYLISPIIHYHAELKTRYGFFTTMSMVSK